MILAKEILNSKINVKFFGYTGQIFTIPHDKLKIIFDAPSIEEGIGIFKIFGAIMSPLDSGNRIPNDLIKPSDNPIIFPELQDSYNFSKFSTRSSVSFVCFIL
ncbi:hypothetical protein [Duffyella gerundensis]|uniref:hypothetical protein n=1 Tax=Duffyella gerundensis TaxID=1619313 RepID=UPI0021F73065|nr:hypothetical protein [Duffyella gerundensis]